MSYTLSNGQGGFDLFDDDGTLLGSYDPRQRRVIYLEESGQDETKAMLDAILKAKRK